MYIKVFAHGKGRGELATDYLVREDYANRDKLPPEVVRGDPNLTANLINSIDREWKYTAGVLSWHPDDKVSKEQEEDIMNDFEQIAFAGLEPDSYNILWVRHKHANHHELHFVMPRMELSMGKAFNPCPPNWQNDFDPLRDYYNIKENWARPDDPSRQRICTPPEADIRYNRLKRWGKEITKSETDKIRDLLIEYIKQRIENGLIENREDIIISFQELGLSINRKGKDYITVQDKESNKKIRLKGGIFNEDWRLGKESSRKIGSRQDSDGRKRTDELERLREKLEEIHRKRCKYNRERYKIHRKPHENIHKSEFKNLPFPLDLRLYVDSGNTLGKQDNNSLYLPSNQQVTGRTYSPTGRERNESEKFGTAQNMGLNSLHKGGTEIYSSADGYGSRKQLESGRTKSNQVDSIIKWRERTEIEEKKSNTENSHERNTKIPERKSYTNAGGAESKNARARRSSSIITRANEQLARGAKELESSIRRFSKLIQELRERLPLFLHMDREGKEGKVKKNEEKIKTLSR